MKTLIWTFKNPLGLNLSHIASYFATSPFNVRNMPFFMFIHYSLFYFPRTSIYKLKADKLVLFREYCNTVSSMWLEVFILFLVLATLIYIYIYIYTIT